MDAKNNPFSREESLLLISQMINKAKNSYHESGIGPMLWGTVITLCSLVTYLQIKFHFSLPFDIWLLTLFAIIPQIILVAKEKKKSRVRGYDDVVMDYIWSCFGIGIFLLIFINANISAALQPVFLHYKELTGQKPMVTYGSFSTSFFLLLYGFPSIITGGYRKFKPMLWGGILCWICCVITVFTPNDIDMLLTALSASAAWLIPGIILYQKNVKGKVTNV